MTEKAVITDAELQLVKEKLEIQLKKQIIKPVLETTADAKSTSLPQSTGPTKPTGFF